MDNPSLFVITGGPGSGKTTVLLELEKRGIPHVPEVARQRERSSSSARWARARPDFFPAMSS